MLLPDQKEERMGTEEALVGQSTSTEAPSQRLEKKSAVMLVCKWSRKSQREKKQVVPPSSVRNLSEVPSQGST